MTTPPERNRKRRPMTDLPLTLACGPYDRTEALWTGVVQPRGIALDYRSIQAPRESSETLVGCQSR